jgi:hypothetical protein
MKSRTPQTFLVALIVLSFASWAQADVHGATEPFVEGNQTTVTITDGEGRPVEDAQLDIVYYPGSDVEHRESAGATNADGEVEWTPHYAGLARLEWTLPDAEKMSEARVVGVRYQRMPKPALAMFLIATFMLFGGLIVGASRMRRAESNPDA